MADLNTLANSIDTSSSAAVVKYDTYLDVARQQTAPVFDAQRQAIDQASQLQFQGAQKGYNDTNAQKPLVQATYANLAKELGVSETTDKGIASAAGNQNIGTAEAGLAAAGLQGAQGSFAAPIKQAQDALDNKISEISNKYSIQRDTLNSEMNRDVGSLTIQADQYFAQGNAALADGLRQQATLQAQHQQDIQGIASSIATVQSEAIKNQLEAIKTTADIEYKQQMAQIAAVNAVERQRHDAATESIAASRVAVESYKASETAGYHQQQLGLAQQKLNLDARKAGVGKVVIQTTGTGANKKEVGLDFRSKEGAPISAGEFLAGASDNGQIKLTDLATLFATSPNPSDQKIAADLKGGAFGSIQDFVNAHGNLFDGADLSSISAQ